MENNTRYTQAVCDYALKNGAQRLQRGHSFVVTNQPVIARGEVTWNGLEEIHNKMETELGKQGAYLDAIIFAHIIHIKDMKEKFLS